MSGPPRIVHFTTVHPPDDGRIFHKECRTLQAAGFEVLLAAPDADRVAGHGVEVLALPSPPPGRLRRILLGPIRLLRHLRALRGDVYHFHDPELLPVGILLRLIGRKVVYDAHEHVRDTISVKTYLPRPVRGVIGGVVGALEWTMARIGTRVVAATPTIAAQFPERKTTVIHNYPILDALPAADFSQAEYQQRPATGVYLGLLTPARMAAEMFTAADIVHGGDPAFRLVTAGRLHDVPDPAGHPGIEFLGLVERERAAALLAEHRFGVMLLEDGPNATDAMPTKFFEYAGAGLPVVASRSTLPIAAIVREAECGIVVDETSPEEVAAAMRRLLDDPDEAYQMGRRGARAVRERFSWHSEGERLVEMYRGICGPGAPGEPAGA